MPSLDRSLARLSNASGMNTHFATSGALILDPRLDAAAPEFPVLRISHELGPGPQMARDMTLFNL